MACSLHYTNLREFVGKVCEIAPKYKAVVQFQLDNKTERALLKYDKLKVDGLSLPEGGSIDQYISKNSSVKFICHGFDDSGVDRCGWYITCAWLQERDSDLKKNDTICNGLYNCSGTVEKLNSRQGVLSYSLNGKEERVLFLASKVYISGKRVSTKANLSKLYGLEEELKFMFDAVPCDPNDNSGCSWFAIVVWRGRKPIMEYDDVRKYRNRPTLSVALPSVSEIKLAISNPHSLFLRCVGQIIKIISPEYGVAFGAIKKNHWESVLFHRSAATLFDLDLKDTDLRTVFEEGDKIRIVAATAPKKMGVRWIASKISVYLDPSIANNLPF